MCCGGSAWAFSTSLSNWNTTAKVDTTRHDTFPQHFDRCLEQNHWLSPKEEQEDYKNRVTDQKLNLQSASSSKRSHSWSCVLELKKSVTTWKLEMVFDSESDYDLLVDSFWNNETVAPEVPLKLTIDYRPGLPLFGTTSLIVRRVETTKPEILSLDPKNLTNMPGFQLLVEEKFIINYDNAKKIRE